MNTHFISVGIEKATLLDDKVAFCEKLDKLLHRIILQSPTRNRSDIWYIGIGELLMTYIVRVHACAQVFIGREMQGRTACHEMHIWHWAELHHIAHVIQQSAMRLG